MKTARIAALFAVALQFALPLVSVFAQGSLTPPGAPAPTMKSLDQVEARTAITNAASQVTISQPGSYYLTRNLTVASGNAININTNGVTLDLNGFTISSTVASAAGTGISLNGGLRNVTIANGMIQGSVTNNGSGVYTGGGFANGISYSGNPPVNVLVSRISVSGCLTDGIYLNIGESTVAEACTVRTVGSFGIYASTIKSCAAVDCGGYAIAGDQVSDCRGECSGTVNGVYAYTAQNCYGYSNGDGINATIALNCYGSSSGVSSGSGINATIAQNCYGSSAGSGNGINATTAQNCYGTSSSGAAGLFASAALNCYGSSDGSGTGLNAVHTASGCYGVSNSGTGLSAFIANVCRGQSTSGTALSATHPVNSF